jgi:hypothetical protein
LITGMKINKLHVPKDKHDINLQFYFFLKQIVKGLSDILCK